eukprot:12940099-Ditylum_brightwellii.AAC.1
MAAELDFWHITKNGATMKEKVIAKGFVVGLICSDTSNDALLLPEKYCGVDAKSGSWRWSELQDDRRWTEAGIVQKNTMRHFGA